MSQVTEQSVRFQTALASIKLIQASAVLDLTEDDFDFLTSKDRKSGSAGMPRPISYAVFCLKKKTVRFPVHCPGRVRCLRRGPGRRGHCCTLRREREGRDRKLTAGHAQL